ncbi:MAG: hypothetical protein NTW50_00930 [Candidatus Berkelbacteria bacterium]|nr:hypothetical protein [Candidatus Berkelbacteria bacterium]
MPEKYPIPVAISLRNVSVNTLNILRDGLRRFWETMIIDQLSINDDEQYLSAQFQTNESGLVKVKQLFEPITFHKGATLNADRWDTPAQGNSSRSTVRSIFD